MNPLQSLADKLAEVFTLEGERTRAEIRAGYTQTRNATRLQGARSVPAVANTSLAPAAGRLVGWSLRAGAGAPAVLNIRDGRDTYAELVAVVTLAADTTGNHSFPGSGVSLTEGLYLEVVSGAVSGALFLGAVD